VTAVTTNDSDERLLRAAAGGDVRAFERLLARYRDRLLAVVRLRLGPRSLWVEDVVQEISLRVHRAAPRFEGRSTVKTWLFSVAINVCREHLRRERRHTTYGHDQPDEAVLAELPSTSLDPLMCLERAERDTLIRDAMSTLGASHRLVLHLRETEDMTYAEMAEVLQVPVGTVRSRVHNGRAALAQALTNRLRS
jgi:RNA polymerase sigma-70 factor (ECF subfamily)